MASICQVFLVLWWWFLLLLLIGLVRLLYRVIQCRHWGSWCEDVCDDGDFIGLKGAAYYIPGLRGCATISSRWDFIRTSRSRPKLSRSRLLSKPQNLATGEPRTCIEGPANLAPAGLFSTRWARTSTALSSWTSSAKWASDLSTKLSSRTKTTTQVEVFQSYKTALLFSNACQWKMLV